MDPENVGLDIARFERPEESQQIRYYNAIIRRLRAPDGCPWDQKQTLTSLRRFVIEESFELLSAIDDNEVSHIAEELGDLFLVATLMADALEIEHGISLSDVLRENGGKLIRRHPHVFGNVLVSGSDEVVANWNQIKKHDEGRQDSLSLISSNLPPLERSYEIQKKAAKQGFDWDTVIPAIEKVREELEELEERIMTLDLLSDTSLAKDNPSVEKEIGDLIFSAVNVSRHLKTDPSVALHRSNEAFRKRFHYIESALEKTGRSIDQCTLSELDALWDEAKTHEKRASETTA